MQHTIFHHLHKQEQTTLVWKSLNLHLGWDTTPCTAFLLLPRFRLTWCPILATDVCDSSGKFQPVGHVTACRFSTTVLSPTGLHEHACGSVTIHGICSMVTTCRNRAGSCAWWTQTLPTNNRWCLPAKWPHVAHSFCTCISFRLDIVPISQGKFARWFAAKHTQFLQMNADLSLASCRKCTVNLGARGQANSSENNTESWGELQNEAL